MSSTQDRSIFGIDVVLIIATLALIVVGVLFIYSSGVTSTGESFSREWIRQIVWAGVGLAILIAVSSVDYTRLKDFAPAVYLALVLVLIGTLLFGRVVNGARSWIGIGTLGVQPSEFMKVATILLLARLCDERKQFLQTIPGFIVAMLVVLLPMALILMQPDLGTALVYLPIFLITAYVAGAKPSHVLFVLLSGLLTIVLTVLPAWEYHIVGQEIAVLSVLRDPKITTIVLGAIMIVTLLSLAGLLLIKRAYFTWLSYGSL
ncbi:MAG: FtsW/RodA/SpoVE family cell cycle protein, partial [Spirochaetales bacterium]